jgi:hypothetical protein
MDPTPIGGHPRPFHRPEKIGDDPDGGQVLDPNGESPEDPLANSLFRGCIISMLGFGCVLALVVIVYYLVTTQ